MAKILLVDPARRFDNTLVRALEQGRHSVRVVSGIQEAISILQAIAFEVIALDLSANRTSDWDLLDGLRAIAMKLDPRPRLLCISERNWGPAMKLDVERKGGRFVLIHE